MGGRPAGVVGEVRPAPGPATDLDRPTAVSDGRCPWPSAGSDGRSHWPSAGLDGRSHWPSAGSDGRSHWPSAGSDGRAVRFGGRPPIEADGR